MSSQNQNQKPLILSQSAYPTRIASASNMNNRTQNKLQSEKNLSESCKEFKFFQKQILITPINLQSTKFSNPFGSTYSTLSQNKSQIKMKQMRKIDNELKAYQKMKKEIITQTLTAQNEPFLEKFNKNIKQEPSEWEQMKKERIMEGKREISRKFKVQKQAITEYLEGKKIDNKIIKTHKEVVMPSPVQRAHHISNKINNLNQDNNNNQLISPVNTITNNNNTNFNNTQQPQHQSQRFYLQSQKKLIQQQLHENQLKQFTASHNANKRPKSALITMLDSSSLKTVKKKKEIDPIKIKMKEFLEKFLKGEQQYFKILEETQKKGQQFFQKSMDISQKFFYDQIEPSQAQFNQSNDLKTSKRYRILRAEQFKLNLPQQMQNYSLHEETYTKKKLGKNQVLKNSFTKVIDEQLSKDERFQQLENYENFDSDTYYSDQLKKQRIGLEKLYNQMENTKEGFERNKNIPKIYLEFLQLVKQNNKRLVQSALDNMPRLVNDVRDHLGQTPLHWAAKRGYKKMTQILINKGANMQTVDLSGKTALDLAIIHEQTKTISLIKKEEAILKAEKNIATNQDEITHLTIATNLFDDDNNNAGYNSNLHQKQLHSNRAIQQKQLVSNSDIQTDRLSLDIKK